MWLRIVFNISVSNTDDHLRNHGFLLTEKGWRLSPAYDINPSIDKDGLALNIDVENNSLDFNLAKSTGEYYMLTKNEMEEIISHVRYVVAKWRSYASEIGISRKDQDLMGPAFQY
jgi:serine/threonine-protein kinase HipA